MDDVSNESGADSRLDVTPGRKLAAGRDADVFELGDGKVLRRYRNGRSSEREAEIMRQAAAHGYPVPAVYHVRGVDMVMERVDGPTMLKDLGDRPWMLWRHARTLARLHRQLRTIPPLDGMQAFPPSAGPSDGARSSAPAPRGSSDALLHLDLHPDNVILSLRGPVVIDWSSAKRGQVSAAVALTWVIMATSDVADTGLRRALVSLIRRLLVSEFLRHAGKAAALEQLPAVAQFRLDDRNVRPAEQDAIRALLRQHGLDSPASGEGM